MDGGLRAGVAALEEGRPEEAFGLFERAAKEGNADAEYCLGRLWEEVGCDFMEEYEEYERLSRAEERYKKAAKSGHGGAALALARLYASPYWLKDEETSLFWYRRAAELGEEEAKRHLAACEEAAGVVGKADGGDPAAMLEAAKLLFAGKYVPKNEKKGLAFLRGAAGKDYPPAVDALADRLCRNRAYGEAATWAERALALGYERWTLPLARMYANGEGVGKNGVRAEELYRLALQRGEAEALCGLGYLYAGDPALYDPAAALRCFREYEAKTGKRAGMTDEIEEAARLFAAEEKDASAAFRLGEAFFYGRGLPRSFLSAREHYERAARLGHAEAMERTADCYYFGEGGNGADGTVDLPKAAHWYERAAECGRASAKKQIALMYHGGEGVPRDCAKALAWIRQLKGDSYFGGDAARLSAAWEKERKG